MTNEITVFLNRESRYKISAVSYYLDECVTGCTINQSKIYLLGQIMAKPVQSRYKYNEGCEIFIANGLRSGKVAPLVKGKALDEGLIEEFKKAFFEKLKGVPN